MKEEYLKKEKKKLRYIEFSRNQNLTDYKMINLHEN